MTAKNNKWCPACNMVVLDEDEALNCLSRKDNKTYLCNECGTAEAIEEISMPTERFIIDGDRFIYKNGFMWAVSEDGVELQRVTFHPNEKCDEPPYIYYVYKGTSLLLSAKDAKMIKNIIKNYRRT